MNKILILLPNRISVLRDIANQDIVTYFDEFSIYYKNIIYPYSEEYDIQIDCEYGNNLGNCWRLSNFDNLPSSFDFKILIYAPYGELVAEKSCIIDIVKQKPYDETTLLCIGDSMTQGEVYIHQAVLKARNIKTLGLKNSKMNVNHEGRGGWTCEKYFTEFDADCTSPFLFPKNIDGKDYYGNLKFWSCVKDHFELYSFTGFTYEEIKDGMYCLKDGDLYKYSNGDFEFIKEKPEFDFDFKKYLERFNYDVPDIVSILFGANELQQIPYAQMQAAVDSYIYNLAKMIDNVLKTGSKVIINLPVCGAEQYSWGIRGFRATSKQYEYNIKMGVKAILEKFDNRREEGIFVCPMLAVCDPDFGFATVGVRPNIYSTETVIHQSNWVHPNEVGYKQMGDALAGTINTIRVL